MAKLIFLQEYPPRDGEEHRKLCFEWKALPTEAERDKKFSTYGVRWSEFARLPYFDLVRYTVVDPMHNLLLGMLTIINIYLTNTQTYT